MAALRSGGPKLRAYFRRHSLLQIYEALLCGVIVMRPEDPLIFLEEKLREIMEKGIDAVLWYLCVDSSLHPKLKRISETHLDTLFGVDAQLMTEELCTKAWNFYSRNLMKLYFGGWIKYNLLKKNKRKKAEQKMALAVVHYNVQILKAVIQKWSMWVWIHKEKIALAASRLQDIFNKINLSAFLKAWHAEARSSSKTNAYFASLAKESQKGFSDSNGLTLKHKTYRFPEKALLQVSMYCTPHSDIQKLLQTKEEQEIRKFVREVDTGTLERSKGVCLQLVGALNPSPEERSANLYFCHLVILSSAVTALFSAIFRYVNLVDLARCAQVSRTWMLLTQNSSLWSDINFSSVKHKVQDNIVVNILQKRRPCVLRLNLRGCYSLHWPSFKSISECRNLQDLNLSECQGLNDESMRLISEGCRSLLYLNLSYTNITNGTLQLLSRNFPNLQYLSLAHCRKFTDKGLQYLGTGTGCHKLIYLDLSGCIQVSVDGFRNIANGCSGIQDLLINEMPTLTDRCIQALVEKCRQITSVVFLDSPHLSDTTFKALTECELVKVRIEGNNQITDLSFKMMSKCCQYIRHIHFAGCRKITDVGLKMISKLKYILVLNMADCLRISDGGVQPFVRGSSGAKLRELNLANCIHVTDASVKEIAQRCHQLTYLNLHHCENVTDAGIEALGNMLSVISIDLSGTCISDKGLRALGRHGKIKRLSLLECKNITDTGIQVLCKGTKHLEYCHVSCCHQLTDEAVKALAFHCHKLTSVSIAGCPKMTDTCIQYLAAACHYLHFLDISGCINLTDKALKCLWKGCKQLQILKMLYCRNITNQRASLDLGRLQNALNLLDRSGFSIGTGWNNMQNIERGSQLDLDIFQILQAVLKYTARLEQRDYSDADPPSWLGYDRDGNTPSSKSTSENLVEQILQNEK